MVQSSSTTVVARLFLPIIIATLFATTLFATAIASPIATSITWHSTKKHPLIPNAFEFHVSFQSWTKNFPNALTITTPSNAHVVALDEGEIDVVCIDYHRYEKVHYHSPAKLVPNGVIFGNFVKLPRMYHRGPGMDAEVRCPGLGIKFDDATTQVVFQISSDGLTQDSVVQNNNGAVVDNEFATKIQLDTATPYDENNQASVFGLIVTTTTRIIGDGKNNSYLVRAPSSTFILPTAAVNSFCSIDIVGGPKDYASCDALNQNELKLSFFTPIPIGSTFKITCPDVIIAWTSPGLVVSTALEFALNYPSPLGQTFGWERPSFFPSQLNYPTKTEPIATNFVWANNFKSSYEEKSNLCQFQIDELRLPLYQTCTPDDEGNCVFKDPVISLKTSPNMKFVQDLIWHAFPCTVALSTGEILWTKGRKRFDVDQGLLSLSLPLLWQGQSATVSCYHAPLTFTDPEAVSGVLDVTINLDSDTKQTMEVLNQRENSLPTFATKVSIPSSYTYNDPMLPYVLPLEIVFEPLTMVIDKDFTISASPERVVFQSRGNVEKISCMRDNYKAISGTWNPSSNSITLHFSQVDSAFLAPGAAKNVVKCETIGLRWYPSGTDTSYNDTFLMFRYGSIDQFGYNYEWRSRYVPPIGEEVIKVIGVSADTIHPTIPNARSFGVQFGPPLSILVESPIALSFPNVGLKHAVIPAPTTTKTAHNCYLEFIKYSKVSSSQWVVAQWTNDGNTGIVTIPQFPKSSDYQSSTLYCPAIGIQILDDTHPYIHTAITATQSPLFTQHGKHVRKYTPSALVGIAESITLSTQTHPTIADTTVFEMTFTNPNSQSPTGFYLNMGQSLDLIVVNDGSKTWGNYECTMKSKLQPTTTIPITVTFNTLTGIIIPFGNNALIKPNESLVSIMCNDLAFKWVKREVEFEYLRFIASGASPGVNIDPQYVLVTNHRQPEPEPEPEPTPTAIAATITPTLTKIDKVLNTRLFTLTFDSIGDGESNLDVNVIVNTVDSNNAQLRLFTLKATSPNFDCTFTPIGGGGSKTVMVPAVFQTDTSSLQLSFVQQPITAGTTGTIDCHNSIILDFTTLSPPRATRMKLTGANRYPISANLPIVDDQPEPEPTTPAIATTMTTTLSRIDRVPNLRSFQLTLTNVGDGQVDLDTNIMANVVENDDPLVVFKLYKTQQVTFDCTFTPTIHSAYHNGPSLVPAEFLSNTNAIELKFSQRQIAAGITGTIDCNNNVILDFGLLSTPRPTQIRLIGDNRVPITADLPIINDEIKWPFKITVPARLPQSRLIVSTITNLPTIDDVGSAITVGIALGGAVCDTKRQVNVILSTANNDNAHIAKIFGLVPAKADCTVNHYLAKFPAPIGSTQPIYSMQFEWPIQEAKEDIFFNLTIQANNDSDDEPFYILYPAQRDTYPFLQPFSRELIKIKYTKWYPSPSRDRSSEVPSFELHFPEYLMPIIGPTLKIGSNSSSTSSASESFVKLAQQPIATTAENNNNNNPLDCIIPQFSKIPVPVKYDKSRIDVLEFDLSKITELQSTSGSPPFVLECPGWGLLPPSDDHTEIEFDIYTTTNAERIDVKSFEEVKKGDADDQKEDENKKKKKGGGISGVLVFFLIILILALIGGLGYFYYVKIWSPKKAKAFRHEMNQGSLLNEL